MMPDCGARPRDQGQGLGTELLMHALVTVIAAGGVSWLSMPSEGAASFYCAQDFRSSPVDPPRLIVKSAPPHERSALPGRATLSLPATPTARWLSRMEPTDLKSNRSARLAGERICLDS